MRPLPRKSVTLHGHRIAYVQRGSGPVLLLIHGMAGSLDTWRAVIDPLAADATVLAVDLPGHGDSDAGGDYSLGALATGLRDVVTALGHDRVTLVGHSLGGGIAMQFSYQFPEFTERLALISSGGLGLEVSPVLRAAALPGADLFLSVTAGATRAASGLAGRVLRAAGARELPVLLVWGAEDPIIPLSHAQAAREILPDSTFEVFEGVRHFPHVEAPERFVATLRAFCAATEPAVYDAELWRARLRALPADD